MKILAFALGAGWACTAVAQADDPAAEKPVAQTSAPAAKPAVRLTGRKVQASSPVPDPQHPEGDDNWPTDDFGRPLRGCDVPWDLVPPPK